MQHKNHEKITHKIEKEITRHYLEIQLEQKTNQLIKELESLNQTDKQNDKDFHLAVDTLNLDLGLKYNSKSGHHTLKDILSNLISSLESQSFPINSKNTSNFNSVLCSILSYFQFLELNGIKSLKKIQTIDSEQDSSKKLATLSGYQRKLVRIRRIWSLSKELNELNRLRNNNLITQDQDLISKWLTKDDATLNYLV